MGLGYCRQQNGRRKIVMAACGRRTSLPDTSILPDEAGSMTGAGEGTVSRRRFINGDWFGRGQAMDPEAK
jgi:hypothetical protein